MHALLMATDLALISRVETAARRVGASVTVTGDLPAAEAAIARERLALVMIDLAAVRVDCGELVRRLRRAGVAPEAQGAEGQAAATTLVAFAPHVHTARLEAARQAGCDQVLSRGKFHRSVETLLAG